MYIFCSCMIRLSVTRAIDIVTALTIVIAIVIVLAIVLAIVMVTPLSIDSGITIAITITKIKLNIYTTKFDFDLEKQYMYNNDISNAKIISYEPNILATMKTVNNNINILISRE